ncbi:glycosyltransferase [Campylobacter gastrosuis]|uniref:Glycosyltransferase n=1 Tax=Campylobacter gastrosuis TaxID=2974576 RepID=A0ABT7HPW7_9BACT|nr:glycosyltransferase [Campylobacter gastrosuis]MDL0088933.1 glycosyltransferase [Campylobacter gastrosuis]
MKILLIISTLKSGGAERVCALLANELCKTHSISLAKFDKNEPFYEINSGVNLINLNLTTQNLGLLGNLKKRFFKIFAIRNLIKNGDFDAVISFLDSTNFLVLFSAFGLKTKIIISEHTSFNAPKSWWVKPLKKALYPHAHALTVLTKADKNHYDKFVKNVSVIYNPNFSKPPQNEPKKQNLVIFVGRLIPLKNCQMFVKIASHFNDECEFIVAGDGVERKNLEKMAKNVKFLGNVKEIDKLYESAKIIISTSIFEGLGNTLIEAIGYDCARISTKTSGACELITNEFDGILIDDEKSGVLALSELLKNEQKRVRICKNARLRLGEFELEKIAKQWEALIK